MPEGGNPIIETKPEREEPAERTEKSKTFESPPAIVSSESNAVSREKISSPPLHPEVPFIEKERQGQNLLKKIEEILSNELEDIFFSLPVELRQEFKQRGEAAAVEIKNILSGEKVNGSKIMKIIKEWLRLIPNANEHYIKQESKTRADNLLKLKSNHG